MAEEVEKFTDVLLCDTLFNRLYLNRTSVHPF